MFLSLLEFLLQVYWLPASPLPVSAPCRDGRKYPEEASDRIGAAGHAQSLDFAAQDFASCPQWHTLEIVRDFPLPLGFLQRSFWVLQSYT